MVETIGANDFYDVFKLTMLCRNSDIGLQILVNMPLQNKYCELEFSYYTYDPGNCIIWGTGLSLTAVLYLTNTRQ